MSAAVPNISWKRPSVTSSKKNIFICRPAYAPVLANELAYRHNITAKVIAPSGVAVPDNQKLPPLEDVAFARQVLPQALEIAAEDPHQAATEIIARLKVLSKRSNRQDMPWTFHAYSNDDDDALATALKVEKMLRQRLPKELPLFWKSYVALEDSPPLILQLWGQDARRLQFSSSSLSAGVLPYPGGVLRMKTIPGIPSRSASKLAEALQLVGFEPKKGDTGVDLGAAPGGWSYVMAMRGVAMTAIDHADLEISQPKKLYGSITHLRENGLKYLPPAPVDWLCCDMVMAATQTLGVIETWVAKELMTHFIVNIKLPNNDPWPSAKLAFDFMAQLKQSGAWKFLMAKQLFHDRNEVTLIGSRS